jgi:O-antigen/teichoic acid export membrane protein
VTAIVSIAARIAGILAQLISVRLAIHYLGMERYGIWLTLSSLTAVLGFADLGLGNGLLNAVSAASGRNDTKSATMYISSAFFMLTGTAALVVLFFGCSYAFIPWHGLFNVRTAIAKAQTAGACAAFALCFAINLPLAIAQRVQMAYQKGYIANAWQVAGNLLSLMGVAGAIRFGGGLPLLVFAFMGGPLASQALNTIHAFFFTFPSVRPRVEYAKRHAAKTLLKTGMAFLAMQVFVTTALASDNVIIARVLGAGAVASYGMVWQLFTTASGFIMLCLMPFMSAYGEAQARGDIPWLRHALRTTSALGFGLSVASGILLIVFGRQIIKLWVGAQFQPSMALLVASALSGIVLCSTHPMGLYLLGTGRLRLSVIEAAVLLPVALLTKVILLRKLGTVGLPLGTALPYLLTVSIPTLIYLTRGVPLSTRLLPCHESKTVDT